VRVRLRLRLRVRARVRVRVRVRVRLLTVGDWLDLEGFGERAVAQLEDESHHRVLEEPRGDRGRADGPERRGGTVLEDDRERLPGLGSG